MPVRTRIHQYIPQQDTWGCALACLAMITNQSYEQVKSDIRCWEGHGVDHLIAQEYLAEKGFATALKYPNRHWEERFVPAKDGSKFRDWETCPREVWPPEPFACFHLCVLKTDNGHHMVLMLDDGTVLDPASPARKPLHQYGEVIQVLGVVPF